MKKIKVSVTLLIVVCLLATMMFGCSKTSAPAATAPAASTAAAATAEPAAEPIVVKIGIAQPLTGACANDGGMSRDGALLALEQMASLPELAGYQIETLEEDDKSDPKDATAIANKWVGDDAILAVIGNYNSSCTLAGAAILCPAGIPQIATGSSSPSITGYSPYLFRTQPTDALVGKDIVEWAEALGYTKAAIIYENSDYGKGLGDLYTSMWKGEIVATETFIPGSTADFTPILTKIKNAGAECVLLGSLYNEAALMGKQAQQVGLDIVFFGDSSLHTNALIELGQAGVENFHVIGAMDANSGDEKIAKFFEDFSAKYGHEPNTFAAQAYDAMSLVLSGLADAGADRDALKDYLTNVKAYPGVTGNLEFVQGDVTKALLHYIVKDGAFVAE